MITVFSFFSISVRTKFGLLTFLSSKFLISNNARNTEDSHWFIYSSPSMKMHMLLRGNLIAKLVQDMIFIPRWLHIILSIPSKTLKCIVHSFFQFSWIYSFSIKYFVLCRYWYHTYQKHCDNFWCLAFSYLWVSASVPIHTIIICVCNPCKFDLISKNFVLSNLSVCG